MNTAASISRTAGGSDRRETVLNLDPRLCAAIVDRLTCSGAIIETGTDSYRLGHTNAQQAAG